MKTYYLTLVMSLLMIKGMAQFVPQPLNYPGPGYWPFFLSIADQQHVWVGTMQENGIPCPFSVKTTDGGSTWSFDSIPVNGMPYCTSVCALDSNTCFFVFTDGVENGGSIWKTMDGGATWNCLTTNQFVDGFANFYHAFSIDTGVGMGDPTNGYFEIQVTVDGGASWTRISQNDIPAPLVGEIGIFDCFSAVGNSVWFATNKGRCFRSNDKGLHWDVTTVITGGPMDCNVCFSTEQNGVFWESGSSTHLIYLTQDGGQSWSSFMFPGSAVVAEMSRVGGFEEGFVVTAYGNFTNVYFTPDMFNTITTLATSVLSNGAVAFLDASTGWIGGGESGTNEILKFTEVLSTLNSMQQEQNILSISPNPSSAVSLIKVKNISPGNDLKLRVSEVSGRTMREIQVPAQGWLSLDAGQFSNGLYIIELLINNKSAVSQKWVVGH